MKQLISLLPMIIAGCSYGINHTIEHSTGTPSQSREHQNFELFKIDSTLRQLDYEQAQANRAISVNDAEKVYLERFAKDLGNKRDRICKELEDEARRNP